MSILSWRASYEIGVPLIDMEHRHLFELVNDYDDACGKHSSADSVQLLNQLINYGQKPFLHEEALMSRIGYPHLSEHQLLHSTLFMTLFAMNERLAGNPAAVEAEIRLMLKHWLVDHILNQDMPIADFIRRQGLSSRLDGLSTEVPPSPGN